MKTKRGKGKAIREPLIVIKRRIIKIGHTPYIALPMGFLERHHLKIGDKVPVIANNILKIIPMSEV